MPPTCSDTNISSGVTTEQAESTLDERGVPRVAEVEGYNCSWSLGVYTEIVKYES